MTGFPEFEQFYVRRFPRRTQAFKSDASTIPPRPHTPATYTRAQDGRKQNPAQQQTRLEILPAKDFIGPAGPVGAVNLLRVNGHAVCDFAENSLTWTGAGTNVPMNDLIMA